MSRYYSDNPEWDYDRYEADQEAWLNSRPVCAWCGEHIQDEHAYRIGGDLVCSDCLEQEKVNVDDLVEEERERLEELRWNSDY